MEASFFDDAGKSYQGYLRCSPEFSLKKILALAMTLAQSPAKNSLHDFSKIYELGPCFRSAEPLDSPHHLTEFFMLEWYRLKAPLEKIMDDVESLLSFIHKEFLAKQDTQHERKKPPLNLERWQRIRFADLFSQHLNLDFNTLHSWDELRKKTLEKKLLPQKDKSLSVEDMLHKLFLIYIHPVLQKKEAVIIYDYPAPLAANSLIKTKSSASHLAYASRFEVYIQGLEVANAFEELCNATEQRRRFLENLKMLQKTQPASRLAKNFSIDEEFLQALKQIPSASGIALGADRLCMLFSQAANVHEVTAFSSKDIFARPGS